MSKYIICYDSKNIVAIRTTSEKVAKKLKKLYPHILEIAEVSGRDCKVQRGYDCDNLTFNEYCEKYPVGPKFKQEEKERERYINVVG